MAEIIWIVIAIVLGAIAIAIYTIIGWLPIMLCYWFEVVPASCPAADAALKIYMAEALIIGGLVGICLIYVMIAGKVPLKVAQFLHYAFVPHPAHRGVKGVGQRREGWAPLNLRKLHEEIRRGTPKKPPRKFVSENMRRKAKAHEERLRDDVDLMETAIERERRRAHYEEEQERRTSRDGRKANPGRGR